MTSMGTACNMLITHCGCAWSRQCCQRGGSCSSCALGRLRPQTASLGSLAALQTIRTRCGQAAPTRTGYAEVVEAQARTTEWPPLGIRSKSPGSACSGSPVTSSPPRERAAPPPRRPRPGACAAGGRAGGTMNFAGGTGGPPMATAKLARRRREREAAAARRRTQSRQPLMLHPPPDATAAVDATSPPPAPAGPTTAA